MSVYVLNPRDVKRYAQGVGRRGKTDRLDAEVIARYVAREHEELHAYVPPSAAWRRLDQLLKRRGKLVSLQVALGPAWRGVPGVSAELQALADAYVRLLQRVDALLKETLAELPAIAADARRVQAIPGYGALSSIAVAHALRRLPFTKADAFVAHTGLDPRPRDSGDMHGRRRLSKRGPAGLRSILHMCGMSASRTPTWRPYYERQLAKGLSPTEAVIVLARKMARTAYALCKTGQSFEARRVLSSSSACQRP
jgi:transposase